MQRASFLIGFGLAALATPSSARADDPAASATPAAAAPSTDATQQLTVPKGGIVIDAYAIASLSSDRVFKPFSISPDIWYGVNDDLTVGLVHSATGIYGFVGTPGTSLCLTGSDNGCSSFYPDVGADVRYRLKAPWVVDGGLYIVNTSPDVQLALKLGASGRWRFNKIAVEFQPNILIFLSNRSDGGTTMMGMTTTTVSPASELLSLPVTATYDVAPKADVGIQTGLQIPFSNAGDFYRVPLSLLGRYHVNDKLSLGLAFTIGALISKNSGFDERSLTLGGTYAL